ncbi:MAG: glycosyltransferase family 2 protein [Patescibacteria group bacterium]
MKITVCIITKNNFVDLLECIVSIASQSTPPDEILIINDLSEQNERLRNLSNHDRYLLETLKHSLKIPFRVYNHRQKSRAAARNMALVLATSQYVAMIDDDCFADFNWIRNIRRTLKKNLSVKVIVGYADTFFQNNSFAIARQIFDSYRKEQSVKVPRGSKIVDFEMFDTKNLTLDKNFFLNRQIGFISYPKPAGVVEIEDCQLGRLFQEKTKHLSNHQSLAMYDRSITIFHKDPTSFGKYLRKYLSSAIGFYYFRKRWPEKQQEKQVIKFRNYWQEHLNRRNKKLNLITKIAVIAVIYTTVAIDYLKNLLLKMDKSITHSQVQACSSRD